MTVAVLSSLVWCSCPQLQCCGVESARDWQQAAWARAAGELDLSVQAPAAYYWVPASCCTVSAAADDTWTPVSPDPLL